MIYPTFRVQNCEDHGVHFSPDPTIHLVLPGQGCYSSLCSGGGFTDHTYYPPPPLPYEILHPWGVEIACLVLIVKSVEAL